jgi:hypothetical protein
MKSNLTTANIMINWLKTIYFDFAKIKKVETSHNQLRDLTNF